MGLTDAIQMSRWLCATHLGDGDSVHWYNLIVKHIDNVGHAPCFICGGEACYFTHDIPRFWEIGDRWYFLMKSGRKMLIPKGLRLYLPIFRFRNFLRKSCRTQMHYDLLFKLERWMGLGG